MAPKRKPAAAKKPAAGGGGCLSLLGFLLLLPFVALAVLVYVMVVFAAGVAQAVFTIPKQRGD